MPHAYVVIATLPGAPELHVVVATGEDDAKEIIVRRAGARAGEFIAVASRLSDEAAEEIGADLSRHGMRRRFYPAGSN